MSHPNGTVPTCLISRAKPDKSNHLIAPTLSANYHHSMKLHWSDWNRACISAAVLLALAGLAVFKIPHGFEEGVGWYLCLLPGAIFAAAISDLIQKVIPQSKSILFDTLLIGFNFLWYFVISYLPLKTYRFISATLRKF